MGEAQEWPQGELEPYPYCFHRSLLEIHAHNQFVASNKLINIPYMELDARLEELTRMKSTGLLSESEYLALVELARSESITNSESGQTDANTPVQKLNMARKLVVIGMGFVALLVSVFVGVGLMGSDNPEDSKEYQELVAKKRQLSIEKAELQQELDSIPDSSDEAEDIKNKTSAWQRVLDEITMLGVS
jgi:hypothetical protein